MSLRRSGTNPLAYMGVEPLQPPDFILDNQDPTTSDTNFNIGTIWLNSVTQTLFVLVNLERRIATWRQLENFVSALVDPTSSDYEYSLGSLWLNTVTQDLFVLVNITGTTAIWAQITTGSGEGILTVTGNSGGAVGPDGTQNITIVGSTANNITITGNPGTNTLTAALTGTLENAVQIGDAAGSLNSIAVGATGTLLVGASAAAPAFATTANGDFGFVSSTANIDRTLTVGNTDNTVAATSQATVHITSGGANVGDPKTTYTITGVTSWTEGIDNSDSDKWKLSQGSALGTNDVMVAFVAGQVLKPLQPAFFATVNPEAAITGDGTVHYIGSVAATTEVFDIGSNFNPGNGAGTPATFTAPVSGIYLFGAALSFDSNAGGGIAASATIAVNMATFYDGGTFPTNVSLPGFVGFNGNIQFTPTVLLQLTAGNTVNWTLSSSGGAKNDDGEGGQIWGVLLC